MLSNELGVLNANLVDTAWSTCTLKEETLLKIYNVRQFLTNIAVRQERCQRSRATSVWIRYLLKKFQSIFLKSMVQWTGPHTNSRTTRCKDGNLLRWSTININGYDSDMMKWSLKVHCCKPTSINVHVAGRMKVSNDQSSSAGNLNHFWFISEQSQPVWRSGQSVGLGIERSRVRNSPVPSGSSLRQGN